MKTLISLTILVALAGCSLFSSEPIVEEKAKEAPVKVVYKQGKVKRILVKRDCPKLPAPPTNPTLADFESWGKMVVDFYRLCSEG